MMRWVPIDIGIMRASTTCLCHAASQLDVLSATVPIIVSLREAFTSLSGELDCISMLLQRFLYISVLHVQAMDPFAAVRAKNKAQGLNIRSQEEVERAKLEQQAKARQMVLQQQAISTAAAASKTQREVYIGNLQQVCVLILLCCRPGHAAAEGLRH